MRHSRLATPVLQRIHRLAEQTGWVAAEVLNERQRVNLNVFVLYLSTVLTGMWKLERRDLRRIPTQYIICMYVGWKYIFRRL